MVYWSLLAVQAPKYASSRFTRIRRGLSILNSNYTQRLQCSSFLVMTYFLLGDENILPKKELHSSLWVGPSRGARGRSLGCFGFWLLGR